MFSSYGRPPKAPIRSAPVRRIYSVLKDEAPKPISFREGSDLSKDSSHLKLVLTYLQYLLL